MTQTAQILRALERGRTLTPLEALTEFGCLRLAARVEELRASGHQIHCRLVERGKKRVGMYWLQK